MKQRSLFKSTSTLTYLGALILAIVLSLFISTIHNSQVSAAPIKDFKAGNIIDDAIFYNKNAMSVQQIQTFLNTLIPNCDIWGTQKSEYGNGTRAQYAKATWGANPPFVCLNKYYESPTTGETSYEKGGGAFSGGLSAAQIIYDAAQKHGINPQVLLVMLKKESAGPLTADSWPLKSQYKYAMGYACPDSGPGYSANCAPGKAGFYKQMMLAAWQLNYYKEHPNDYRYRIGWNDIQYSTDPSCGTKRVYIENIATLSLYIYTPYTPNNGALAAYPGQAKCGAYGNRNFYQFFKEWFGSTQFDYSSVFNAQYYLNNNNDLRSAFGTDEQAALTHFLQYGMNEGRQANAAFNVTSYGMSNQDLRKIFKEDLPQYYVHYSKYGKKEGRTATGSSAMHDGINYTSVFDGTYYLDKNSDLKNKLNNNIVAAFIHFTQYGMNEGRQANAAFNAIYYMNKYPDLRWTPGFGWNLPAYYKHYVQYGKPEGRIANQNTPIQYLSSLNGVDYSAVYNFTSYQTKNSDVKNRLGLNDQTTLQHFVQYGMAEGRQASDSFNVLNYKNRYQDLRNAFGKNLKEYYIHYVRYGKSEGRIST